MEYTDPMNIYAYIKTDEGRRWLVDGKSSIVDSSIFLNDFSK